MARGITEQDVHSAADELVAAGERPTIERIRAHLGTGSPNTVTRWLDTEWWALALEHARAAAHESIASDRVALQTDREALRKEREEFAAEAAALREQMEAAIHAERLASIQAAELQRLASQLEAQVEEMARQRDAALARASESDDALEAQLAKLQDLPAALEAVWRRSEVHKSARKASAKKIGSARLPPKR